MQAFSLAENFDKYFAIKVANTEELRKESYRIRHMVYSEELGWEPTQPSGLEVDECDDYAHPLLLEHKRTGAYAGTVRLVVPPPHNPEAKLPFELHCEETIQRDVVNPDHLQRGAFGEISRLSVPNSFRRRLDEQHKPFVINEMSSGDIFSEEERRNFPNIAIGLYLSVIAMVKMCNHSHMFVVVEPRLKKRLGRLGLNFTQCGEELDYHGIRALFVLEHERLTSDLSVEILELYQLLENQLREQLVLHPFHYKQSG
ncbi:PEP-CTERM/exosortase system-associated acyltransferase [Aestuariibacter halophilus]|uniref:PEP-CTERM/exosortase system-associated acyltransferase n=1 Tax=Fluctibacter halophilus TaxID=226011 RepID=A0ABS8G356_9ALTE|nr:PEP-CTERM/exosortase system-associated acyltransferase [Aestuariibacter halophilus]MCC2614903.1 PEP-CTERM/exosortase system-associated acyltransferase [Aestuariibacter halophilus]